VEGELTLVGVTRPVVLIIQQAHCEPAICRAEGEVVVQRSSFEVAGALGLGKRGALRQGWQADVIVMDTAKVAERATYEQPELLAEGMQYVIVNGALAVSEGKLTGAMAGRGVRRTKR